MNNLKSDDTINILERIAHFYVDLEGFEWTDFLSGKPKNYDTMKFPQKADFTSNILYKLEYLLDNPKDTLIHWSWFHRHLYQSFDEFLSYQFEMIPDNKTWKESLFERIANKVKEWRERKQE